ncbi:MAG: sulfite oxidase-like oxidoreductase [Chloroflexaceae bacterium]|nr:sulfite oxidase-like oxidoreductase [Chloroflexaceae bacterium]
MFFKKGDNRTPPGQENRVPPGQYVTEKFPVLHYGNVPRYETLDDWDLRVWGEIAEPATFTHAQLRALPTVEVTMDIHCVTRWSKLDTCWEGVRFRDFLQHIPALKPSAQFLLAHAEQGFTANIPLELMLEDDALLAYRYDGRELDPEHGYPLRLVVPQKYFWKSAKWLRGIEFLAEDTPGFWERYGYNNNADPWREERYAD